MKGFAGDFLGAFGDTGTFIPLALGLIIICGLSPTAVFLPAGLLYIVAGYYYKIPFPVQPLKAVAAIALVNALKPELIAATAYLMSFLMVIILCFDLAKYLDRVFSKPIVRGIQCGLGLLLIRSGLTLIAKGEIVSGILLPEVPFGGITLGPYAFSIFLPSLSETALAFFLLLIPQVPLTLGNSMVATADLAQEYYGANAKKVTYRNLARTIGTGNFFAGLIMGMPLCHGCGGLTAHYRFGARTARSNLIVGIFFVFIALLFARMSPHLLSAVPLPLFGVTLLYVGISHTLLARDMRKAHDLAIIVTMGLVTLIYNNLTVSLFAGIALRETIKFKSYFERLSTLCKSFFLKK
jgi:SulP family sulfate permease